MTKTLLVVADRTKAKLFMKTAYSSPFKLMEEVENLEGRKKDGEINSDGPGKRFQMGRRWLNPLTASQRPAEHALEKFVKSVVDHLMRLHNSGHFDRLIVAAEAHTLGILRKSLKKHKSLPEVEEVKKDLMHCSENDIVSHLDSIKMLQPLEHHQDRLGL